MTDVLHSPSSSSPTSISTTPTHHNATLFHPTQSYSPAEQSISVLTTVDNVEEEEIRVKEKREKDRRDQLSLLALLVTLFRKSFWLACKTDRDNFPSATAGGEGSGGGGGGGMEIGWPTDVEHVNHVTFDRFDGFLGLPVEFEPEVPRRAPSASATVFGVSTESMQLSYDLRGNSIPTILLLLQRHLYSQGGLQAEGIFRITAGNSQDEYVRDQLNRGVIPGGIDVHCLAGLIKAWFRELPRGILDSLSPEQVMQSQSEDDCEALVRLLPQTEASLLDWAINLMADVVQEEHINKMNSRNIAMVFAPNMTQMADPLTALMYAVQVMNFLKTLIEKTLRERLDPVLESSSIPHMEPSDENGHRSFPQLQIEDPVESYEEATAHAFVIEDPCSDSSSETNQYSCNNSYSTSTQESDESETRGEVYIVTSGFKNQFEEGKTSKTGRSNGSRIDLDDDVAPKSDCMSNLSRINSITERCEAWR
ncbi:hypothetical protein ABFS83_04G211700 [Erythranthe nasuta]